MTAVTIQAECVACGELFPIPARALTVLPRTCRTDTPAAELRCPFCRTLAAHPLHQADTEPVAWTPKLFAGALGAAAAVLAVLSVGLR